MTDSSNTDTQPRADDYTGDEYFVALDCFEGPLDLLLHLVRRHELDILDIPIAFVCQKYVEYLEFARALDLDVAGEYLVMAATLAYIKSRGLLPADSEEQKDEELVEEEDPREQLIHRLLAYQTYRKAADDLDAQPIAGRDTFTRGMEPEVPLTDPELAPITLFRLAEAYHRILGRAKIHKQHEVVRERVSVADRMRQLTLMFHSEPSINFEKLFTERTWSSKEELRSMLVVTLMSVLEMVKLGLVKVHQLSGSQEILLERGTDMACADTMIRDYDEESEFGSGADDNEK